nr:MAG TPA: hypothetical protein [Caudoviricetes sp.]
MRLKPNAARTKQLSRLMKWAFNYPPYLCASKMLFV